MQKPLLFGIHAEPPPWIRRIYPLILFALAIFLYAGVSDKYLAENPGGKVLPSFLTMAEHMYELAFVPDSRTGVYLLWSDTAISLMRFCGGIFLATVCGLLLGVNMALFPGMRSIMLPFVTACSNVPTLALLPILLIMLGIGDTAKVALIFLSVVFYITRDIYGATMDIPRELPVKARTLGASQLALVYRIILPMMMPRLFEAVRLSLGIAWWSLISSEGIAASEGLGYRIFLLRRYLDMATIIPYVLWITLLAFTINYAMIKAQQYLYPWKSDQEE